MYFSACLHIYMCASVSPFMHLHVCVPIVCSRASSSLKYFDHTTPFAKTYCLKSEIFFNETDYAQNDREIQWFVETGAWSLIIFPIHLDFREK